MKNLLYTGGIATLSLLSCGTETIKKEVHESGHQNGLNAERIEAKEKVKVVDTCNSQLTYLLSVSSLSELQDHRKQHGVQIQKYRELSLVKGDQFVGDLEKKYQGGVYWQDLITEIESAGFYQDLVNILGGKTKIAEVDLVNFFVGISNFAPSNKEGKWQFLPITKVETIDPLLFQKYPEIYNVRKETHNNVPDIMLCNTKVYRYDNTKCPHSQGFSGCGNNIFLQNKLSGEEFEYVLLNEITGEYFDQCFGDRAWSKKLVRNNGHVYYTKDKDFLLSNENIDGNSGVLAADVNELRGDLYTLQHFSHIKKNVRSVLLKGFMYASLLHFQGEENPTVKQKIAQYFTQEYKNAGYVVTGEFFSKHFGEIYQLYGIEQDYTNFKEMLVKSRVGGITMPEVFNGELDKLINLILGKPDIFAQRAKNKFTCLNNNLLELNK